MITQRNSLMFRYLGPFPPNGLSIIYKNLPYLIQNAFWPLSKFLLTKSLFKMFPAKQPPHLQEGQELDNSTWFVYWSSYYLTQSTPRQFPIHHNAIQLDNFTLFVYWSNYDYNWPSPHQFNMTIKSYSHTPVIETTSKNKSLIKISHTIIIFCL